MVVPYQNWRLPDMIKKNIKVERRRMWSFILTGDFKRARRVVRKIRAHKHSLKNLKD